LQQLKKRESKITQFDYADAWAEMLTSEQESQAVVLTWGSTFGSAKEAVTELNREGLSIDLLALRLLMPLRADAIKKLCEDKKVIVVEQSYSGQFYHYCLGQGAIDTSALSLSEPGPLVLKTFEIKHFIKEALA
jgi:pyruvate/2-oxoacid:ferredoxin oxidoreductase alpha subunit